MIRKLGISLNPSRFREIGIMVFTIVLIIIISIRSPYFLTIGNIRDILMDSVILAIAAIGQMLVILTANIDISVSAIIAFNGFVISLINSQFLGMNPILAIIMGIVIGGVLGLINGIIIAKGRVPAIITTLGTMSIYRGITFIISRGQWIGAHEMSDSFKAISSSTFLKVPSLFYYLMLIIVIFYYILNFTHFGRKIYMVGSNNDVANMLGINSHRVTIMVFTISGLLYGLCGVLWASRYASAQSDSAKGFEFTIIGACVIGGISIFGGIGKLRGVLLGAILMGILANALPLLRVNPFWKQAIQGLVILIAVIFDALISRRLKRNLRILS